ncbi:hypothetical protein [Selenomonas ruminantium]|uniref:hypothetical protein n=1 Tax=Selenomonas ruminantium TaxID=971 RepID=UPI0013156F4F|nr:hypothetical protein [Selenomonas ruminantium]
MKNLADRKEDKRLAKAIAAALMAGLWVSNPKYHDLSQQGNCPGRRVPIRGDLG